MIISWSLEDCGFGELTFYCDKNDKWTIDSEAMNRESVMKILGTLVYSLPLEDEKKKPKSKAKRK